MLNYRQGCASPPQFVGIHTISHATSAMDLQTAPAVLKVLRDEFRDLTVVCVAHRMETIEGMDLVVELEDGIVKEIRRRS